MTVKYDHTGSECYKISPRVFPLPLAILFLSLGLACSCFLIYKIRCEAKMEVLFALKSYQKVLERTDSKWVIHSDPVGHSQARSFLKNTGS